jgi:hypothetical protein
VYLLFLISESFAPVNDKKAPASAAGPGRARWVAALLLCLAIAFNLYHLYPEVAIQTPRLNDGVLHLLALEQMASSLAAGQDPTDSWLATVSLGYPLFHHYQHLAYLLPAILHYLSGGALALPPLFYWTQYLLLSLFPLSIYWSMRRFGFDSLPAALAGLLAPLLSTNALLGYDFASYVWRGAGLYTQLWAMLLLPPALAQGYVTLRTGRGYLWATLLLAATLLTHLVSGYMAVISLGVLAVVGARAPTPAPSPNLGEGNSPSPGGRGSWGVRWQRGKRLLLLLALTALVAAYFLLPFWLDRAYMNRSVWEKPDKYDSYGYEWVLRALVRGELFDFGRFPSLTILAGVGLALCLWHWREERYRIPVALALVWLLLYFGRPTWGILLDLLPMSRDLHLHRLIAGVHLGGIYLAGLGLAWPWQWALARQKASYLLVTTTLTALLLYPVYAERGAYLAQNARWMADSQAALAAEEQDIAALVAALKIMPPGRVYAGLGNNWGRAYTVGMVPMYTLLNNAGLDMLGYLYHALSLNAEVQVLFDENRPDHYNLFNVRYVVAPAERTFPDFVRPVQNFGRHRLYRVMTSGYFDLVDTDVAFTGEKSDFYPAASAWLSSPLLPARQHPALLFEATPLGQHLSRLPLAQAAQILPQLSLPPELPRGRILSQAVESAAYLAEVEVTRESTLLLKATYHPNWHAYVDGVEVEPMMVMPSFIGVRVAPGVHQVRLEYRPRPLRGILLLVGLLALPLIALAERRREELARWVGRLIPAHWPGLRVGKSLLAGERLTPHLPFLGMLLLMTLLAGLPLFQFKIMKGHDALEYLPRAVEFYEGLKAGQLFPRWAPDLSAGYGQPFFSFNPPLFYYVAALFRFFGFSFVAAQDLAIFALLLLSGLGMYLLAGEFFGRRGGLVSAVAYLFAPYLLVNLYVRHALADFSAFAFMPLAWWSLYCFSMGRGYRFLLMGAPALALLILSSNPVALMAFPALVLFLGWLAWAERSRSAPILKRGLWYLGLGLGLSAFFWLPALVERNLVHTARVLTGYLNYQNHFVYLSQLIYSPWGYGLSRPGLHDEMSFAIGPIHLVLAVAAIWLLRRIRARPGQGGLLVTFFLALLGLAAFFASGESLFLWEQLPLLQYLEFPWRFLSLVAVSTAFLCGFPFLLLGPEKDRLAYWLMVGLIGALFLLGFPKARPETFLAVTDADYSPGMIALRRISVTTAEEYEPVWVQERPQTPAPERLSLLSGAGNISAISLSPTQYLFQAAIMAAARLRVNTFYFPGWTLYVDGLERPVEYNNPQGVMEFSLEPGEHLIRVVFADTPVRQASARLSLLALGLLILTPWLGKLYSYLFSKVATPASGDKMAEAGAKRQPLVDFRTQLGLYLLFCSIYLMSGSGHFWSTDHVAVYLTTQSLVENHNLAIKPINNTVIGPDGRAYAVFGLGQSILSIPFYLLGTFVDDLSPPALKTYWGGVNLGDWGGTVPIFFVSLFNQFVTPLICLLVFLFCRQIGFSARRSFAITLLFGLSTAAWVSAHDYFQHALESLCLLFSIYILFAHRDHLQPRHALLSGLSLALGLLTRVNLLFIIPAMAIYLLYLVLQNKWADPVPQQMPAGVQAGQIPLPGSSGLQKLWCWSRAAGLFQYLLAFSLPIILAFTLILYLNQVRFGHYLVFNPVVVKHGLSSPIWLGFYGNLLSPGRSIFLYSPPIILALFTCQRFYRRHRAEALLFLAIFMIYLVSYSLWSDWHGYWAWGPRYLWATIPLFMIPAGYFLDSQRNAVIAALLACLGMGVQILGVAINCSYMYWDWLRMNLSPQNAFLFVPDISPIPMYFRALLEQRHLDLWLLWVYRQFGLPAFLVTISVPLLALGQSLLLLKDLWFLKPNT